jgi:hypothetical protein
MSEEMQKLLEEEAKKLQETCIIKDVIEQVRTDQVTEQTIDIEHEVVEEKKEELFEVYVAPKTTILVSEEVREEGYVLCEDGSYTTFDAYLVVDDKIYNLLKYDREVDEFGTSYIISKPETWRWLLRFDTNNTYKEQNRISVHNVEYERRREDEDDYDEDEEGDDYDEITEEVQYVSSINHYVKLSDLLKYGYEVDGDKLVRRVLIEEFREKLFTKYPYFVDTIKSLYGDNWDISYHTKFNKYCLIIKFDKFSITNSKDQFHEIVDLYFLVPFTNDLLLHSSLYGGRGSMTTIEKAANYAHSHLNGGWSSIAAFCLGSGPISTYIAAFNVTPDENNLFSVLYNIKIYVEWESIEGTPYKYIENIGKQSSGRITPTLNFNNVYKDYLIDHKLPLKIKVINGITDIVIDQNILEVQLLDYVDKHGLLKVYKDPTLGTYQEAIKTDTLSEQVSETPLLTYKGVEIYTKTFKLKQQIKIEDQEYVIHPEISRAFIENALPRIRDYNFKKNTGIYPGKGNYYNI